MRSKKIYLPIILIILMALPVAVHAEGSRSMYPNGVGGSRADLEWTTNTYGPAGFIRRRTILNVYAQEGEALLLGSSGMGAGAANILVYAPGSVTGPIGAELIDGTLDLPATINTVSGGASAADGLVWNCNVDDAGTGVIADRAAELAGPLPSANANAYTPCTYIIPPGGTGIYHVLMFGRLGPNTASSGSPNGGLNFTGDANKSSVRAWDVTVRAAPAGVVGTTNIDGRLFTNYLSLFTGSNGRPLFPTVYAMTLDGYLYQTDLNGLDPNGFLVYGNRTGFFDTDGVSPLYRNVVSASGTSGGVAAQLQTLEGGVTMQRPQFPIFFVDNRPQVLTVSGLLGIPTAPTTPILSAFNYSGDVGNTSLINNGGTFTFSSNVAGRYELVISNNPTTPNYDPTLPTNRVLRGDAVAGANTVTWDGLDNVGTAFPVGNDYPYRVTVRAGEYHFPLIDAENSVNGGPSYTVVNPPGGICPPYTGGCSTGFYDDRGYVTLNGNNVGTLNTVLCGNSPSAQPVSNLITGFDTTSNQRGFGAASGGNSNRSCLGSATFGNFGDAKGLDTWTYYPSNEELGRLNVVDVLPMPIPPPPSAPGPSEEVVQAEPPPQPTPTLTPELEQITRLPDAGETPPWRSNAIATLVALVGLLATAGAITLRMGVNNV